MAFVQLKRSIWNDTGLHARLMKQPNIKAGWRDPLSSRIFKLKCLYLKIASVHSILQNTTSKSYARIVTFFPFPHFYLQCVFISVIA
jgi:hypothetical protein